MERGRIKKKNKEFAYKIKMKIKLEN